jgi:hypothetical protein
MLNQLFSAYAGEAQWRLDFSAGVRRRFSRGFFGMDRTDSETWALASMLIDKHGAGALPYAEARADEAADDRDETGHAVWLAIAEAIRELQRGAAKDDAVN